METLFLSIWSNVVLNPEEWSTETPEFESFGRTQSSEEPDPLDWQAAQEQK